MRSRIEQLAGANAAMRLWIGTFHALLPAFSALRRNGSATPKRFPSSIRRMHSASYGYYSLNTAPLFNNGLRSKSRISFPSRKTP